MARVGHSRLNVPKCRRSHGNAGVNTYCVQQLLIVFPLSLLFPFQLLLHLSPSDVCVRCSFGAALNGYYCPVNSSVRILTPPGYFNNNFFPAAPKPCAPGNYCPVDPLTGRYRAPYACPSGTFSVGLQTNCTVCPAGTYCTQPE